MQQNNNQNNETNRPTKCNRGQTLGQIARREKILAQNTLYVWCVHWNHIWRRGLTLLLLGQNYNNVALTRNIKSRWMKEGSFLSDLSKIVFTWSWVCRIMGVCFRVGWIISASKKLTIHQSIPCGIYYHTLCRHPFLHFPSPACVKVTHDLKWNTVGYTHTHTFTHCHH